MKKYDPFSQLGAIDQRLFQKPENQKTSKEAKKFASKPANQQTSKQKKKFGSYLSPESIMELKKIALETHKKDYDILQEAVDEYIKQWKLST